MVIIQGALSFGKERNVENIPLFLIIPCNQLPFTFASSNDSEFSPVPVLPFMLLKLKKKNSSFSETYSASQIISYQVK